MQIRAGIVKKGIALISFLFLFIVFFKVNTFGYELIDDFEDGVVNQQLWDVLEGNYGGGEGIGYVREENGALVLDSQDTARYGGGLSAVILKESYLDTKIYFSFELMLKDTIFGAAYCPGFNFMAIENPACNYEPGWTCCTGNRSTVLTIRHDQQNVINELTGVYYYYFDSQTKTVGLYDENDNLLGSASYADFSGDEAYILLCAYTDTFDGEIQVKFNLKEIWTEEDDGPKELTISGKIIFVDINGTPLNDSEMVNLDGKEYKNYIPSNINVLVFKKNTGGVEKLASKTIYNPGPYSNIHYSITFNKEEDNIYDIGVSVYGSDLKLLQFEFAHDGKVWPGQDTNFYLTLVDLRKIWPTFAPESSKPIIYKFNTSVSSDDFKKEIKEAFKIWERVKNENDEKIFNFEEQLSSQAVDIEFINKKLEDEKGSWPAETKFCGWPLCFLDPRHKVWIDISSNNWTNDRTYTQEFLCPLEENLCRIWVGEDAGIKGWPRMMITAHEIGHVLGLKDAEKAIIKNNGIADTDFRNEQYTIMSYRGHHGWLGWSDVWSIRRKHDKTFKATVKCPVDLVVQDLNGLIISKNLNQIEGAIYIEEDIDSDGDLDDQITIPEPASGEYFIEIIPEPNADPSELITLEVYDHGEINILLDRVTVSEIPSQPITVTVDRTPPLLSIDAQPDILPIAIDQKVQINIEIHLEDNLDENPKVVLGEIVPNWDVNPNDVISEAKYDEDDRNFELRAIKHLGEDYQYTITYAAYDSTGNIAHASTNIIVPAIECEIVNNLSARAKSGKVQLTWAHVEADSYNIYRKTDNKEYLFIANTTSTYSTYLDNNVTNGITYYYLVRSVCNGLENENSNEVVITPNARTR